MTDIQKIQKNRYVDIIGHSYGLSQDLVNLFGNQVRPLLNLGQLFRDARLGFPALIFGDRFPADCYGENSRILRGLEMAHHVQLIRARIWKARGAAAAAAAAAAAGDAMMTTMDAGERAEVGTREYHYLTLTRELLALQEVSSVHCLQAFLSCLPPFLSSLHPIFMQLYIIILRELSLLLFFFFFFGLVCLLCVHISRHTKTSSNGRPHSPRRT